MFREKILFIKHFSAALYELVLSLGLHLLGHTLEIRRSCLDELHPLSVFLMSPFKPFFAAFEQLFLELTVQKAFIFDFHFRTDEFSDLAPFILALLDSLRRDVACNV